MFEALISYWGTSFTLAGVGGGTYEQISLWESWLNIQRALTTAPGGAPLGYSLPELELAAENDFVHHTPLVDPSWKASGKVNSLYAKYRGFYANHIFGGDPATAHT